LQDDLFTFVLPLLLPLAKQRQKAKATEKVLYKGCLLLLQRQQSTGVLLPQQKSKKKKKK
jgi:hypothetical protein